MTIKRKIRMGMVGGGRDGFIGAAHRCASRLDGLIELVGGAFCADPAESQLTGKELFLSSDRVYGTYQEMFQKESARPKDDRLDFITIATPNHLHFPVAKMALESGFNVVCEKPMTYSLEEAFELQKLVKSTGKLFALTHNYTGYPMVKEARRLVKAGTLGKIRKIVAEYPQGWLATRLESTGQQQASWRTNPKQSGKSCCIGDIGTHAENLAEYITGLKISELCADITTFVPGRELEDDGNILLRFENGARGVLFASQISVGEENALAIRIYGEKGGLEWRQEEPNTLIMKWIDRPSERLRAGANHAYLSYDARSQCRLPAGHPEGFLEAFANIYRNVALTIGCQLNGEQPKPEYLDFPRVEDGVRGIAFIDAVLQSAGAGSRWQKLSL